MRSWKRQRRAGIVSVRTIWHHAHEWPKGRKYGINFGISLSFWDYVFGTAVIPHDGRDIKLGFPGLDQFPKKFISQELHGFKKKSN